jgi:hypothetical protein
VIVRVYLNLFRFPIQRPRNWQLNRNRAVSWPESQNRHVSEPKIGNRAIPGPKIKIGRLRIQKSLIGLPIIGPLERTTLSLYLSSFSLSLFSLSSLSCDCRNNFRVCFAMLRLSSIIRVTGKLLISFVIILPSSHSSPFFCLFPGP